MNEISITDLVACVCQVIDLTSNSLKDHHIKTAWGAFHLSEAMGLKGEERRDVILAASIHDIGALSLNDRVSALTLGFEDSNGHSEKGYRLLLGRPYINNIAQIIRYHHTPWNYGKAVDSDGEPIPLGSQIVLMADRISVMIKPGLDMLNQGSSLAEYLSSQEGEIYRPDLVAALKKVSAKDAFWLDIISRSFDGFLKEKIGEDDILLDGQDMLDALSMISDIIDFRSTFTAAHSKGVAVVAVELARLMDFSDEDCQLMRVAGLLHDVGKLAVPVEILDKKTPLTVYERSVIRSHAYYTERVLSHLTNFNKIKEWASLHNENLDGSGYPFRLSAKDLSMGTRIMKVADVYAALIEERPYMKGMAVEDAIRVLEELVKAGKMEGSVVKVLSDNRHDITRALREEHLKAYESYNEFRKGLESV